MVVASSLHSLDSALDSIERKVVDAIVYHPDLSGPRLHSPRCCEFGLLMTHRSAVLWGLLSAEDNHSTQHHASSSEGNLHSMTSP